MITFDLKNLNQYFARTSPTLLRKFNSGEMYSYVVGFLQQEDAVEWNGDSRIWGEVELQCHQFCSDKAYCFFPTEKTHRLPVKKLQVN